MFRVYKKAHYQGCFIIVRHVGGNVWEYLMFRKQEFYAAYMIVKPQWWRNFVREQYTPQQVKGICQRLVDMACATIETLDKKEAEERLKADKEKEKK